MAATIFRYDNAGNSLGTLPYDTATHDEALDGTDKLTVVSEISPTKRDRLVWQDDGGAWHEHLVDTAKRTHADKGARTESLCSNSISELYGLIANGTRIRAKVQSIMSTLLAGTRWTVGTCDDFGVVEIEVYHKSVRECIAELCELCKGELETVVTVGDSGVTQRVARIVKERGNKAVVRQFQYGRNVSSILREVASEEVYTAVKGYGAKLLEDDDSEFPARLEVLAESSMDLTRWGVPMPNGTFAHNYTTYTDAQCTDRQFLLRQCRSVLASVSKPLVRYEFDTADAGNGLWSDVRLGDRVMCVDELFNPPLELIERVSQIRRNLRGRIQCRIAIGARANPLLEQYKAAEKVSRVSTGNPSRISSHTPIRTGGAGYDGEGAPSIGDVDIPTTTEPSSIAVTTPPAKTEYYDGETIDFSGIVVTLYNSDGSVYTDDWHPDGVASFDELTFEPTTAQPSDGQHVIGMGEMAEDEVNATFRNMTDSTTESLLMNMPFAFTTFDESFTEEWWNDEHTDGILPGYNDGEPLITNFSADAPVYVVAFHYWLNESSSYYWLMEFSTAPFSFVRNTHTPRGNKSRSNVTSQAYRTNRTQHLTQPFYMAYMGGTSTTSGQWSSSATVNEWAHDESYIQPSQMSDLLAYVALYGGLSTFEEVVPELVKWMRQDGMTLETTFDITVKPAPFEPVHNEWHGNEGDAPNPWGDPEILYPELYS